MSRYETLKAALLAQLAAALPEITGGVRGYEPVNVEPPAIYVLLQSYTRTQAAQITATTYTLIVRAVFLNTEAAAAETRLGPYVDSVGAAVDANPTLGGAVTTGQAACTGGTAGYWTVSGVVYRVVDATVTILDKQPAGGI